MRSDLPNDADPNNIFLHKQKQDSWKWQNLQLKLLDKSWCTLSNNFLHFLPGVCDLQGCSLSLSSDNKRRKKKKKGGGGDGTNTYLDIYRNAKTVHIHLRWLLATIRVCPTHYHLAHIGMIHRCHCALKIMERKSMSFPLQH